MSKYSLLSDRLISVNSSEHEKMMMSLPDILAHLSASKDISFLDLQIHQQHAWHAFLVQLASMALASHSCRKVEEIEAKTWRSLLLDMTSGNEDAWCLIVNDWDKAAFMQPPSPPGTDFNNPDARRTISEIDVLVLSRNHDIKKNRLLNPNLDHWVFNLVNYQTMNGFLGQKNYNIARMNGGWGSRPCVTLKHGENWGQRFCIDTDISLNIRPNLIGINSLGFAYRYSEGHQLLWVLPWDGNSQIEILDCDPFFIEVCRRIKLQEENGKIIAYFIGTNKERVNAAFLKGKTGDIWTPLDISKDEAQALTVPESGFSYEMKRRLIFDDQMIPSPAMSWDYREIDSYDLYAEVVSRGKGQTNGYHSCQLPMPKKIVRLFADTTSKRLLAEKAKEQVEDAKNIKKILRISLLVFLQGDQTRLNFDDHRHEKVVQRLDNIIDARFFSHLWETSENETMEARIAWQKLIIEDASHVLLQAFRSLPCPDARRYKSITNAERCFWGQINKLFPKSLEKKGGTDDDTVSNI
ncbi:hypothetical protein JW823_10055 [bacterium]|nr:hypothetical protein [candidate division CSSED10-310 bacterium]